MNLTGNKIKNSYKALLTFPGATGMVSNPTDLKQMGDGGGNNTPFYLSTTQAGLQYTGQTADTTFIGFTLRNNTSAAASDMQHSPFIEQVGNGYTASSKQIGFRYGVVPTSGTAGYWAIDSSVDGALATYTNRIRFYDTGIVSIGDSGTGAGINLLNQAYVRVATVAGTLDAYNYVFGRSANNAALIGQYGSGNGIILYQGDHGTVGLRDQISITNNLFVGGAGVAASAKLHVLSTTEQLRLGYDASNYVTHTVSSAGVYTIAPSGGVINITGEFKPTGFISTPDAGGYGIRTADNHTSILLYGGATDVMTFRINGELMRLLSSGIFLINATTAVNSSVQKFQVVGGINAVLPTSDAGLVAGDFYTSVGVVMQKL